MSEIVAVKKRGRPKKSAIEAASVIAEATEPKKARTARAKTTSQDEIFSNPEPTVKASSQTGKALKDSLSKHAAEVVASKNSSVSKGSKKAAAVSTTNSKSSASGENDARTGSSAVRTSAKTAKPSTQPALKQGNEELNPSTSGELLKKEGAQSSSSRILLAAASEPSSEQSVPRSPAIVDLEPAVKTQVSDASTADQILSEEVHASPSTPAPRPTSRILEALSQQSTSSTITSPSCPPPLNPIGPKFSASLPLNSPPPTSMSSSPSSSSSSKPQPSSRTTNPSPSSLPRAKPHQPPLPSGPPNPAQSPVTPQQIETIRQSPAYRAASGRWTRGIVALPIAIVTSWVLWDRYQNGTITTLPTFPRRPRGGDPGDGEAEGGSTPPILGDHSSDGSSSSRGQNQRIVVVSGDGGAKPRVIDNYLPGVGFVVREKRLLDL